MRIEPCKRRPNLGHIPRRPLQWPEEGDRSVEPEPSSSGVHSIRPPLSGLHHKHPLPRTSPWATLYCPFGAPIGPSFFGNLGKGNREIFRELNSCLRASVGISAPCLATHPFNANDLFSDLIDQSRCSDDPLKWSNLIF